MKRPTVIPAGTLTGARLIRSATRSPESASRAAICCSSAPAACNRNQPMNASHAPVKIPWKISSRIPPAIST